MPSKRKPSPLSNKNGSDTSSEKSSESVENEEMKPGAGEGLFIPDMRDLKKKKAERLAKSNGKKTPKQSGASKVRDPEPEPDPEPETVEPAAEEDVEELEMMSPLMKGLMTPMITGKITGDSRQGYTLMLEGLRERDVQRVATVAHYLAQKGYIPAAHPAYVLKFALDLLVGEVVKEIKDKAREIEARISAQHASEAAQPGM